MATLRVPRGSPLAQQVFLLVVRLLSLDLPGLRVSSYTGGVHVSDSQHPLGTAMDFGVRTASERRDAMLLLARWRRVPWLGAALGPGDAGHADHVHVQLFHAGSNYLDL